MTLIGNIFLVVATLIFFGLSSMLISKQTPPTGDYGVGYAWLLIVGNLAFTVCMAIVAVIIASNGGFSWIGGQSSSRSLIVLLAFVLAMVGNFFFAMKEGMGFLPSSVRQILQHYVPVLLPILLLASSAILLNDNWRLAVPAVVYKIPLLFTVVMGVCAVGLIMAQSTRNSIARFQSESDFEKQNYQNHLDQIDSTDVMKDMVFILVFTDANHAMEVRERALAKIKSRPDWQEELVRRLQNDWAPEVFTFLASNEVDDKAMFAEPVLEGAFIQARLIRENIRSCRGAYDLYPGKFTWETERVLRTIEKFKGMGVDYRPAVQEMRAAMDEPTDFEKPKLHCKTLLNNWLKN